MSSSKNKDEFLGIGIKFPFRINASTGKTALIDGANTYNVVNFVKVQSDGTNWWVIG